MASSIPLRVPSTTWCRCCWAARHQQSTIHGCMWSATSQKGIATIPTTMMRGERRDRQHPMNFGEGERMFTSHASWLAHAALSTSSSNRHQHPLLLLLLLLRLIFRGQLCQLGTRAQGLKPTIGVGICQTEAPAATILACRMIAATLFLLQVKTWSPSLLATRRREGMSHGPP